MRTPIEGPVLCSFGRVWRTASGAICQYDGVQELFAIEVRMPEENGLVPLVARITIPLAELTREFLRSRGEARVEGTMTQFRMPKPVPKEAGK